MARKVFYSGLISNGCGIKTHNTRGMSVCGRGMGSVLLDNGIGGQSSYQSVDEYISTTGRNPYHTGGSLERMNRKLESLIPNKKKPKNINFSL